MDGGGGNDGFIFGSEASNGKVERDFILDYQIGQDFIGLTEGAKVASVADSSSGAVVYLEGDGDAIYVQGAGVTSEALTLLVVDSLSAYDWHMG